MNGPGAKHGHPELTNLLGHWEGYTHVAAGPWGPEHRVSAQVSYTQVAGGLGVVQSYRHVEPDGSHFEGHGIFTIDPVHNDVLWYYVDSTGVPPGNAARCTSRDGVIRVERRNAGGWTRHSIEVANGVLTHVTELRSHGRNDGDDAPEAGVDGKASPYSPFMRSEFHRAGGGG